MYNFESTLTKNEIKRKNMPTSTGELENGGSQRQHSITQNVLQVDKTEERAA